MPARQPCDRPLEVVADDDEVIIGEPPPLVTSLTPEAAEESSNPLYECTAKARGQCINEAGQHARKRKAIK